METISQIQKRYGSRAMTLAIIAALVLIVLDQKSVAKGLVLGTLFSVINFVVMGQTLSLKMGGTERKAFFMSFGSIVLRYGLMAVPLVMAIKLDQFNLFAVIAGIFMVQIFILSDHVISTIRRKPM
jgi:hypothetical protein